jgi:hypothetical protein
LTINPLSSLSGSSACLTLDAARKLVAAANRQGPPPLDRQLLELARRRGDAGFTLNDALLDLQHNPTTPVQQVREEIERLLLEHLLDVGNDERGRIVYREP